MKRIALILALMLAGCTSVQEPPAEPEPQPVAMRMVEAVVEEQPQLVARVRIVEMLPDEPVMKRLAVYNPEFWNYPYRDWVSVQIPEGEAWEGWWATTSTGKAIVEWEYSVPLLYGGLEQSANMKDWHRAFTIDHYYIEYDELNNLWRRKVSVPLVANPENNSTDKQFFRLEFPWVNDLTGVQQ